MDLGQRLNAMLVISQCPSQGVHSSAGYHCKICATDHIYFSTFDALHSTLGLQSSSLLSVMPAVCSSAGRQKSRSQNLLTKLNKQKTQYHGVPWFCPIHPYREMLCGIAIVSICSRKLQVRQV